MGTRGLTMVVVDGSVRVAQYGQWDHYPSAQGVRALTFLREMDEPAFRAKLNQCRWITEEEHKALWANVLGGAEKEWVTMDESAAFHRQADARFLSRDHGAKILAAIATDTTDGPLLLSDNRSFAGDSLFCEYAYVVDFDTRTFEVYKGFNKGDAPEGERFSGVERAHAEYGPVRLLASFSLDALPTEEEFLKACGA